VQLAAVVEVVVCPLPNWGNNKSRMDKDSNTNRGNATEMERELAGIFGKVNMCYAFV